MQVQVLSPSKVVEKKEANEIMVAGFEGYMGVLPGHASMISQLGCGKLQLDNGTSYFVSGGYIQVENDEVTVLADVIEEVALIDVERAKESKKRAEARLKETSQEYKVDYNRAQLSLRRAEERLELAKKQ